MLTAGHNLFDPDKKVKAENINFYAGEMVVRTLPSAKICKKHIFLKNWDNGDKEYDMGIIVLDRTNRKTTWVGMVCSAVQILSYIV